MKLLAVSGGPDSMYLLEWYKKQKVVVAHVNYKKREDSDNDQRIVEKFCKEHNIPCEVYVVKEKPVGNFQSWARDIRYKFFKQIYDKYGCNQLLTAHHRDDFLETAIMQQRSGRTPRYFGIRKEKEVMGMKVKRPFIDLYWKDEILFQLKNLNQEYAIDSSNEKPIFERNKIRLELHTKDINDKIKLMKWFKMSNSILKKKFSKVDAFYKKWKSKNYEVAFFRVVKHQEEVVYEFIHDNFNDASLSSNKINSLIDFILSKDGGKKFMIDKTNYISKAKGYVTINK